MADNYVTNPGVGGATFRAIDGGGVLWPVGLGGYGSTGGTVTVVDQTHGLPVQQQTGASFLVNAPVGNPVFVRLSDGTSAIANLPMNFAQYAGATVGALNPVHVQLVGGQTVVVDGSGGTFPVTGTVGISGTVTVAAHAVTQSGTWNVGTITSITNVVHVDDNGGSITVDGSVSVSGLVPGVSATSLGKAEDAAAADGDTGVMTLAVRKDTAATTVGSDGDYHPIEVDGNGRLWVNGSSVVQPVSGTVTANAGSGTFTVTGAVQAAQSGAWTVTNLSQLGGAAVAMDTGVRGAGVQRVTICTNDLVTVQDLPVTSGGTTPYLLISAATTNATSVKGSAGQVYGVEVFSTNAAARYLKLYNKATAPTVGTDVPIKVLTIPGNTAGAGLVINWDKGIAFGTGIAFALTTGAANADTGAVAANEIIVNVNYK